MSDLDSSDISDLEAMGRQALHDADPVQFELYSLAIARKWAESTLTSPYRIEYRTHEPIDILIEESEASDMLKLPNAKHVAGRAAPQRHFIECKLYGRDLSLSVVGVSYLHAFRERPRSLVIATNRELTGGAQEFASWLFNTQMGKTTTFYTWNPFDQDGALAVGRDMAMEAPAETASGVHRSPVVIDRWSLKERMPFQDIPIASSDGESRSEYFMRPDARLVFRAFLRNPVRGRRIGGITLRFQEPGHHPVLVSLEKIGEIAGRLEVQGIIRASDLRPNVSYPRPDLDVAMSSGQDSLCGMPGFPFLHVEPKAIILSDLRADETDALYKRWMRTSGAPLMIVQGEGGAGKTYLCGQIAERAVRSGFRATHTPLEVRTELAFVTEMVWLLLSPDLRALLKETDHVLTGSLLAELGAASGGSVTESDAAALATLILEGRWEGSSPEILLQSIARLIVSSHRPLLFVISNAHRLSDSVAYGIRTLLAAIEAAGWGQVRMIIEARDTPEDLGSDWLNLKSWTVKALGHRIIEHTVRPLDEAGLRKSLTKSITSVDGQLMAKLIAGKSGGNPLF